MYLWEIKYILYIVSSNISPVCRSSVFYNFVKAMLVRNPKKRPGASKMLSVSNVHFMFPSGLYHFCIRFTGLINNIKTEGIILTWFEVQQPDLANCLLFVASCNKHVQLSSSCLWLCLLHPSCLHPSPLCSTRFWPSSAWTRSWPWTCWRSVDTPRSPAWLQRTTRLRF